MAIRLLTKQQTVIDHFATGERMRQMRIANGISLREISRRMKKSVAYLSDLERGRRSWNQLRLKSFVDALRK